MADLPDLYPLFFYDQEEKGMSPRTILQRRSDLKGFQAEFPDPRDVTPRLLEVWLSKTKREVSTERTILYSVSEFYKFGMGKGILKANPAVEPLASRPTKNSARAVMATEDLERAIEWSSGHPRLWMALSAFQGPPCREIAELTTEHFNSMSAPTTLQPSGKASTTWRSSQLHPTVIAAINAAKLPSRGLLFPDQDNQKISRTVNDHLRDIEIRASAMDLVWWYRKQYEDLGVDFDRGPGKVSTPLYSPTKDEQTILVALNSQTPAGANAYLQALSDLSSPEQVSFRRTAHELRSVLLDVIDKLAPDRDVVAVSGFKYESNQTVPRQAQKVRFILQKRLGRTARVPAEVTFERSEELFGKLSRAVYSSGSKSSHQVTSKSDVLQYKRYIDTVLFDLLGIA